MTRAAPLLAALLSFAACHAGPHAGEVVHVVSAWLKEGTPAEKDAAKAKLIATARSFQQQIDGIVSVSAGDALTSGQPGDAVPPDLVLVMRFASESALAAYLAHPVHVGAVTDVLAPATHRVEIRDVVLR